MIDLIELKNFQAHRKTTLELTPGINVIIGESDQGKSSIVRALYWVYRNKPAGDEFIRTGSKECCVAIHTKNKTIQRQRNNKGTKNKYIVDDQEYNALRSEVPEQVTEILNLTDTNIQFQDDPPFMLSLNSGEVARKLNSVAGLDQIDSSIKHVNSIVREIKSQIKYKKKEQEKKKEKLKKYEALDKIKELHGEYEKLQKRLTENDQALELIQSTLDTLEAALPILAYENDILALVTDVEEMEEMLQESKERKREYERVSKLFSYLSKAEKTIEVREKQVEELDQELSKLEKSVNNYASLSKKNMKIKKHLKNLSEYHASTNKLQKAHANKENALEKLKASLKFCPLCEEPFQSIKGKKK